MVHDRRVDGAILTLGVSGKVRDGNLVMYDRQTGSLWLQQSGKALEGRLRGQALKELPRAQYEPAVRWDEWQSKHPATKVLHCDHCLPLTKQRRPPTSPNK